MAPVNVVVEVGVNASRFDNGSTSAVECWFA
jgi:hypothetical protein